MKKIVLIVFVSVLLSTAVAVGFIRPAVAEETIYIRADGSIEGTTDISTVDNITYTFTDNIFNQSIIVERDNIVVDGAGFALHGAYLGYAAGGSLWGISIEDRRNITIRKLEIKSFWRAIFVEGSLKICISESNIINNTYGISLMFSSNNNTISGNNIANNTYGIDLISSSNNIISGNNITDNYEGIWLQISSNNFIYHNNFVNNTNQVKSSNSVNDWDDGYPSGGNYWSDYTGIDTNGDGVGDSPYVLDENSQDNYPLMSPWTPTWSPSPVEEEEVPLWVQWWLWAIVAVVIVALAGAVYFLKKRKPPTPTAPPPPTEGT